MLECRHKRRRCRKMTMAKIDFKKTLKELYLPSAKEVVAVEAPVMNFAMVEGAGDPNGSQEFQDGVQALYGVTFTIKMSPKKGPAPVGYFEYVVPPLEGLWWLKGAKAFDMSRNKKDWCWTLMIMQPEFVTAELVADALRHLKKKKENPALDKLRFEVFDEGAAVQIMHIGPYADEGPTIEKMHAFAKEKGYQLTGKHHEIYLSDPRKTRPEKLRTVLRQPVRMGKA